MAKTNGESAIDDYTKDGSVDLRGNPVLRSKSGGWKACSFIVVYELFERMAYYGIASNLVLYLTNELHQGTVTASNNVTNWSGAVWIMPILGAYVADAYLGRYWTFIIGSVIYLLGMILLTLAVSIPSLKPPKCGFGTADVNCRVNKASSLQLGVYFAALYIIALGTAGTKPNISTIGAEQFDEYHPKERVHKLSFFNWWMFVIFIGILFANTLLVYIQDNVGWTVGYALPTLGLVISVIIFLVGTPFYRHKMPLGSPFTRMVQVLVAALRKWRVPFPDDPLELYELKAGDYEGKLKRRIECYTPSMRVLSKAAVKTAKSQSQWYLCPVSQVEETKQMLRMIPVLAVNIIPCVIVAQISTLFLKQGATLDRSIGPHFRIPPASLGGFVTFSMLVSIVLYIRFFVPFTRRLTGNPRGISFLYRMGIGIIIHIVTMVIASLTERHRLAIARSSGVAESGAQVPITIFLIVPQYVLMGIADTFIDVARIEFFYDQAPEGMKSLGTSYTLTCLGFGNFISSFLLKTTEKVTRRRSGGNGGWILNNLNKSHLDYYYAFLAVLCFLNFVFFLVVCRFYVYRVETVDLEEAKHEDEAANTDSADKAVKSLIISP
ncbi:hypothetical protein HPP92_008342 [Vanilla planifolia]|uniref:Uncharacterized protein n=1 Tax=Vanilla planifolia TaxID=51239 RepID=A0A835V5K6_VANPL|nr:hypothetical protein HPP92_008342 [Vanilla planifolia]